MDRAERFPYRALAPELGQASLLPILPLVLELPGRSLSVSGLVDTGATVNVLPFQAGLDLGAVWEDQNITVGLSGNLAHYEARVLIVSATVGQFAPVSLAFAWTESRDVPVILGQVNFLMEFDACFYRSQQAFEVKPRA